ncbi:hypothetical protein C7212DRAFT_318701 [Tuber magnatum]|uniref:Uncharacterized protein n=1 Tax=Tuber magnatum TaxID=42249 RepID=A0A317SP51_9PEZI|nr:hypothetical protein C7212DRAFT_318701 [Tuber magnatum]
MVSGEWRMTFITDAPGDGYGKTQRSPPELCSDGDLLWEDAERARKSPKGMRQSSFLERARSGSPKTRARDSGDRSDGRNLRLERRRSQSPVLMRAFQESNIRDVEEEEQQDLGSSKQKLDTEDRRADSNDWD